MLKVMSKRSHIVTQRLFFMVLKKSLFIMDKFAEEILRADKRLTFSQLDVLTGIYIMERTSQQLVASVLQKTQASVSRQVSLLLRKKLITRVQNTKNKREHILTCTPLGVAYVRGVMKTLDDRFEPVFAVLPLDEMKKMIAQLEKITFYIKTHNGVPQKIFEEMSACDAKIKENIAKL